MRGARTTRRLGVALAALLLAGCGRPAAPGDEVPGLSAGLARVDDAIVAGRYDQARNRLEQLVGLTTDARSAGDLEREDADRILAAVATLMSSLPARQQDEPTRVEEPASTNPTPAPEAPTTTAPEPRATTVPEAGEPQPRPGGDGDTHRAEGSGPGHAKSKGPDKAKGTGPGKAKGTGPGKGPGKAKGKG
jgi:hypothetical protein